VHVRITKRGKTLITRGKPSASPAAASLSHDRSKRYPLAADRPDPFLQAIGIMGETGRVRASMQGKFHQINEFLRLMWEVFDQGRRAEAARRSGDRPSHPIHIVDCGCGNAYLTFAAYHYLNHLQGIAASVTGVDVRPEAIAHCRQLAQSLGWQGLDFHLSRIADFTPDAPPDIVVSLHACDTATDEAIAQGIIWGSRVILAAPCCQHELQEQLRAAVMRPVLRHGILKERTADILTDALRALALRIMGYRTEVVEFVSPEHTSKNLMIRATRESKPGDRALVREYQELKAFWGVKPAIETLLGDRLIALL
jgi:SAM-dependent methyltransferase